MVNRTFPLIVMLLMVGTVSSWAQCDDRPGPDGLNWEFETERKSFNLFRFLGDAFTPRIVHDVNAMRAYVRDSRFAELSRRCGDLRAIDAICVPSKWRSTTLAERCFFP
jgi:hypothetical protein